MQLTETMITVLEQTLTERFTNVYRGGPWRVEVIRGLINRLVISLSGRVNGQLVEHAHEVERLFLESCSERQFVDYIDGVAVRWERQLTELLRANPPSSPSLPVRGVMIDDWGATMQISPTARQIYDQSIDSFNQAIQAALTSAAPPITLRQGFDVALLPETIEVTTGFTPPEPERVSCWQRLASGGIL
jgi:hypothetical protein